MREILRQGAWWVLNKALCRLVGMEASLLLTYLGDVENLLINKDEDVSNGFHIGDKKIEEDTFFSPYKIGELRKILIKHKFLQVKKRGVPARNFYKISWDLLQDFFITSDEKIKSQVTKIFGHYIYKNLIKNIRKKQAQVLKDFEVKAKEENIVVKKWMIDLLIVFMKYRYEDRKKTMGMPSVKKFIKMCNEHGFEKINFVVNQCMENDWIGIRYENIIATKSEKKNEELNRSRQMGDKWAKKNQQIRDNKNAV